MENLFYILLFAIVTIIISIWGIFKERSKSNDLLDLLYKKSEKAILKAFKNKTTLSKNDIEKELLNIKASLFYSKDKLVINDPSHLTKILIGNMLQDGVIKKTTNGYTLSNKTI